MAFKAYSIIDIYSRKVVGYRVEEREVDDLAVEMFQDAFAVHGIPEAVHADSGPAMRSTVLKDLLGDLGVTQTHNRPRVSNDNPFSESEFRTMKYRPNYPGTFDRPRARPRLHGLVRALVQRAPQALRHRAVLTERGPRRHLAHASGSNATRPSRPTTTHTPRRFHRRPTTPHARRHRRHQPAQDQKPDDRTTPRSLTTPV